MGNVVSMRGHRAKVLKLKISVSKGHRGKVQNVTWTWPDFIQRTKEPTRDVLTLKQFKELPEEAQLRKKNNGYFVGAQFKSGLRKKALMAERYLITFDLDECTPELLAELQLGTSGIGDMEYVLYSTRQHSEAKPRIRLVLPMTAPLSLDKFEPASRILAAKLDPTMKAVDPVSFREAQYMYWPSVCAGEDFVHRHNKGTLLDPEALLAEYGDWENFANLPRGEREENLRRAEAKLTDPRLKRNIIGAFCQTYDVHYAIRKFLPDVYAPSETDSAGQPTRYTYIPGTTSNGVVVYDDGMSLHSHHGSDPVGGHSVNPFDLVRVHLFGPKDWELEDKPDMRDMPSYKAMVESLEDDTEVKAALVGQHYGDSDDVWDDLPPDPDVSVEDEETEVVIDGRDWKVDLDVTKEGVIKSTMPNIVMILANAARFKGCLAYNEFTHEIIVLKTVKAKKLFATATGRSRDNPDGAYMDRHAAALRLILEAPPAMSGWGLRVTDRDLLEAVRLVAYRHAFHPVRDYLGGLVWDGVPRVERLWHTYLHTPDDAYHRATAECFMLGAVMRIFHPGSKFDFVPMIEGLQGVRKSTFVRALAGVEWTGESEGHFDNLARMVESLKGHWFVEIPELGGFTKNEVNEVKAGLSRQKDQVRLAYARNPETYYRQNVFMGTTNDRRYLRDPTGNRRFWPIECGPGQIDTEAVRRDRDQLWAETMAIYSDMRLDIPEGDLPLDLRGEAKDTALRLQGERVIEDAAYYNAELIRQWLDTPVTADQAIMGAEPDTAAGGFDDADVPLVLRNVTCGREIWEKALNGKPEDYGVRGGVAIGKAMVLIPEWEPGKALRCALYGQPRTYRRKSFAGLLLR